MLSNQNFVRISHLPMRYVLPILLDLITLMSLVKSIKLLSSSLCQFLHPPDTVFVSSWYSYSLQPSTLVFFFFRRRAKFDTHTKLVEL
jgi:hypothetical protein